MNLLSRIDFKSARTAADYADRIVAAKAAIAEATLRLDSLQSQREHAVFGEGDVTVIAAEIGATRAEIENLEVAIVAADRRRLEALDRETTATVEQRMHDAKQIETEEVKLIRLYHKQAKELAGTLEQLKELSERRTDANKYAVDNGRPDLKISNIYSELSNLNWEIFDQFYAGTSNPRPYHVTPPFEGVNPLADYWPRKAPSKHLGANMIWEHAGRTGSSGQKPESRAGISTIAQRPRH